MKRIFYALAILISASAALNAQNFDVAKMDSLFSLIENYNKGMGSISILRDGTEVYQRSYGYTDVENKVKIGSETKFRIGSISKTFTATIIMKLVEEGKLSLADALKDYYPQIANADSITIEQLLRHTSGIANFTSVEDYTEWNTLEHTKEQVIERIVGVGTSKPGEKFAYSNSNYALLTFIAEDVSGKSYSELLNELIVIPCALKHTYVGDKINSMNNEAYSYMKLSDWEKEPETAMGIPLGAGFIVSTPFDLNVFLTDLFNHKIVSEASLDTMMTLRKGFGLGLFRVSLDGIDGYGHTGGIDGFQSNAFYFPDQNVSIAITENGVVYPLLDILQGAISIICMKEYQLPHFTKAITLQADELDKYLGVYASDSLPIKMAIFKKGNTLMLQGTGQPAFALECFEENKFKLEMAGAVLEFIPTEQKLILHQHGMAFEMLRE